MIVMLIIDPKVLLIVFITNINEKILFHRNIIKNTKKMIKQKKTYSEK